MRCDTTGPDRTASTASGRAPPPSPVLRNLCSMSGTVFHERRRVPWWWWVVGTVIAVPTTEGVVVLGPEMTNHPTALLAIACLIVTLLAEAAFLLLLGRSDVDVDENGLRAGRATLAANHLGRAQSLDAVSARRLLGPGLRADAELSLRPWIKSAVQIEVEDHDDRTPYWVVATRRPAELVAALDLVRRAKAEL
jgi:hypothetical protein